MKELINKNFISFEGIDGSGKTTIIKSLAHELKKREKEIIITREPGGHDLRFSEQIRKIIFDNKDINIKTELLLFEAGRSEHLDKVILPNLKLGKIVLCDRFVDSSVIYQSILNYELPNGESKKISKEEIIALNKFTTDDFLPNITFLLDVKPEIALQRINPDLRETTRFDKASIAYHLKARDKYLKLAKNNPDRFIIINANQNFKNILNEILLILEEKLQW